MSTQIAGPIVIETIVNKIHLCVRVRVHVRVCVYVIRTKYAISMEYQSLTQSLCMIIISAVQ